MEQLPIPKYIKVPSKIYKYNIADKEDKQEVEIEQRINPFFITRYFPGIMIADGKEHDYTGIYMGNEYILAHITVDQFEQLIADYIEELKQDEITGK